jgi:hypothetical protein
MARSSPKDKPKNKPCWLPETPYSICLQLPSIPGGCLHLQPEDMPFNGDQEPTQSYCMGLGALNTRAGSQIFAQQFYLVTTLVLNKYVHL